MVKPSDIPTNHYFQNSGLQSVICEKILRNIVILQKAKNPDEWTPFSWSDYQEFCTHQVSSKELEILNAMVHGGYKPSRNFDGYSLNPGWLALEDEQYTFTEKMITMLEEKYAELD